MLEQEASGRNLVVVHYMDGGLLKGCTHDFLPTKEVFHITSESEKDKGTIHVVELAPPQISTEEFNPKFELSLSDK